MSISRIVSFCCISIGGIIAIYAQADAQQNQYILITGIVLLMFGIYRISRGIPSKSENEHDQTFVKTEADE